MPISDRTKIPTRKTTNQMKKPRPEMLGTGGAGKAGKKLEGRKAQLEKQLKEMGIY